MDVSSTRSAQPRSPTALMVLSIRSAEHAERSVGGPGKEPEADHADDDQNERTDAPEIDALTEEDGPYDSRSGGSDADKGGVDRRRRQPLDRLRQQKICRDREDEHDNERRPSRHWRRPLQCERPSDLEQIGTENE